MATLPMSALNSSAQTLAVAYYRVSTAEQASEGHQSLGVQRDKAHREAAKRGLMIIREFTDVASGAKSMRAQYQQMLSYLRSGGAGTVFIQALDRLGRNQRELLTAAWELHDLGVMLVAIDKEFDATNIIDAAIAPMMAQLESEKISMRVRGAISRAVKGGSKVGRAPYGYRKRIREGGAAEWEQDPAQAAIIRKMYELRVQGAKGFRAIADALNAEDIPSRYGSTWAATTVQKILANPALRGAMDFSSGRYIRTMKEGIEPHVIEDYFPAILSTGEWDRLASFNKGAAGARGRVNVGGFLLSTLLRCGHCGGPMAGRTSKGRRQYVCSRYQRSRARCRFSNSHAAHRLETAVLEWVERHTDPAMVKASVSIDGATQAEARLRRRKSIEKELTRSDGAFRANLELLRRGVIDEDGFRRDNEPREAQRKVLIDELARIDAEAAKTVEVETFIDEAPMLAKDVAAQLSEGNVGAAKAALRRLISSASVNTENTITLTIAGVPA